MIEEVQPTAAVAFEQLVALAAVGSPEQSVEERLGAEELQLQLLATVVAPLHHSSSQGCIWISTVASFRIDSSSLRWKELEQ